MIDKYKRLTAEEDDTVTKTPKAPPKGSHVENGEMTSFAAMPFPQTPPELRQLINEAKQARRAYDGDSQWSTGDNGDAASESAPQPVDDSGVRAPGSFELSRPVQAAPIEGYSKAFVERLQAQHRERMAAALENSRAALEVKEAEIRAMHQQVAKLEADHTARESAAREEIARAQRQADELLASTREARDADTQEHERALAELRRAHEEDVRKIRAGYDETIRQLREWARTQLSGVEETRQSEAELVRREMTQHLNARTKELERERERRREEVAGLRALLAAESERAAQLQSDSTDVHAQAAQERLSLQTELAAAQRDARAARKELASLIERTDAEARSTEEERARHAEQQSAQFHTERRVFVTRNEELVRQLRETEERRREQLAATAEDLKVMTEHLERGRNVAEALEAENVELRQLVSTRTAEVELLASELRAASSELERVRRANEELRLEIERQDRILYGKRTRGARQRGAKATR